MTDEINFLREEMKNTAKKQWPYQALCLSNLRWYF